MLVKNCSECEYRDYVLVSEVGFGGWYICRFGELNKAPYIHKTPNEGKPDWCPNEGE